jgi:hypothetical protein
MYGKKKILIINRSFNPMNSPCSFWRARFKVDGFYKNFRKSLLQLFNVFGFNLEKVLG